MQQRANIGRRYLIQLALMAVFIIGFSLWALYDAMVGYPDQRVRGLKYEELREQERTSEWHKIADANGWSQERPGKPKSEADITTQYWMFGIVAPIGLLVLIQCVRQIGRWVEVTDTGLTASWGQELEFGQIIELDKKKWKDKGIAKVRYDVNGRKKTFVLDDFKYDREPMGEILREVEAQIGVEKIVRGAPEPPPGAEEEEAYDSDDAVEEDAVEEDAVEEDAVEEDAVEEDAREETIEEDEQK